MPRRTRNAPAGTGRTASSSAGTSGPATPGLRTGNGLARRATTHRCAAGREASTRAASPPPPRVATPCGASSRSPTAHPSGRGTGSRPGPGPRAWPPGRPAAGRTGGRCGGPSRTSQTPGSRLRACPPDDHLPLEPVDRIALQRRCLRPAEPAEQHHRRQPGVVHLLEQPQPLGGGEEHRLIWFGGGAFHPRTGVVRAESVFKGGLQHGRQDVHADLLRPPAHLGLVQLHYPLVHVHAGDPAEPR